MLLEWSSIDQKCFHFVPHDLTRRGHSAAETPSFVPLPEAQIRSEPEPSSFSGESAIYFIRTEEQSHPNAGPTRFGSALDKFNEIIPGCDAMRRFQENPNWCLANNRFGSRCGWRMPFGIQHMIRQLLAEAAEMNIYVNMEECIDQLVELASIAVCHHQQYAIIWKLKSLLRVEPSRSFNQVIPMHSVSQTEKSRSTDRSGSALMKQESGPYLARKDRETKSPVTTSAIKVTYWLRQPPRHAIHYLPEYLPYHPPEAYPRSVRERVEEEARRPLYIRDPGFTGGFQELDERLDGYLYIYWNRASFGLVKIGCTTVNVDQRLQDWEDKCRHLAEEHYRSPFRIKHVARVEKLIHTEFREYRVFEPYCHGCGRKHIEWFRGLDLALVIDRIKAWTEWVMKAPYEEDRWGHWRLKDSREFALPQICATPGGSDSPKKGKVAAMAKESPRYQLRRRRTPESSQRPASPSRAWKATLQMRAGKAES
jgi:T5orf172 domain